MASSRSLRSSKKQTRLQFQPLSSSSPVKGSYSEAIQDRLANIRYNGGRRTPTTLMQEKQDEEQSLPTPQPTSPAGARAPSIKTSSPLSSLSTSPAVPPRFTNTKLESSSEDDEDEIVLPSVKRRKLSTLDQDPYEADGVPFSTPTRRSSRLATHAKSPPKSVSSASSQRVASVDVPPLSKVLADIGSAETSDDDVMATQPVIRRRGKQQTAQNIDPFIVEDDEFEVEASEVEPTPRRPRRKNNKDDFVVENDEIEFITSSEEDTQPSSSSKRRQVSKRESPQSAQKHSRRRAKKVQDELAEDLLDLQDSDQERSWKESRTRGGPVTTQRDISKQHFDLLKKRRAHKGMRPLVVESDEPDDAANLGDDGTELDHIGRDHNPIDIISDESMSLQDEQELMQEPAWADEDDDFVVDDQPSTGRLGRPNPDIPLQFTSFATAKPRELFPHIVEWMVKNKISPAFNRHDDLYKLSFSRLDDQVKAQAGSRLISSAWNATFKHTILARPGINVAALPGLDEEWIRTCDACNKSNHPARYEFVFSGKAYYKNSLEPIDESDDDTDKDEDDDDQRIDDQGSSDEQGHLLASQGTRFYLGRFCAANAEMSHKLTHWKHHLNDEVLSYLEEQGVLAAHAIVQREKLNKKKREREAEGIVDMMREIGVVGELWQSFQDDLEDARIGMEGHERKGGRSQARIGSVRVLRDDGAVGEWLDGGQYRSVRAARESGGE